MLEFNVAAVLLLWSTVVSSLTFCSWKQTNIYTYPVQLSIQCADPSTPIIIIENAIIAFAQNPTNNNSYCPNFIDCSQRVPDFALYCTGFNTSCSLNQANFYASYASQSCGYNTSTGVPLYMNYVQVNYSCIAARVLPPSDVCNSQQSLYSTSFYLSTTSSFPISNLFPPTPIQCSCSLKPLDQSITANISIRALIVDLEDYFNPCSQKLTIRSCLDSNDTVFCSRSVSSSVTSYSQLELNPSISFKSNSSFGRFLLEIRTLSSSISGTIGSLTCNRTNVIPACSTPPTNRPMTTVFTTSNQSHQTTNQLTTATLAVDQQTQPTPSQQLLTTDSTTTSDTVYPSTDTTSDLTAVGTRSSLIMLQKDNRTGISSGAIGGIVAGVLILLILVVILIFVYRRMNRRKPSLLNATPANNCAHMNGNPNFGVTEYNPDCETGHTYQGLNLKSHQGSWQNSVEYQTLQRPHDTSQELQSRDVRINGQREPSYLELVGSMKEPSPDSRAGVSQNYQALNANEMKTHKNQPCDKVYQVLHHPHVGTDREVPHSKQPHSGTNDEHSDANTMPHVTTMFQRSTLYDSNT